MLVQVASTAAVVFAFHPLWFYFGRVALAHVLYKLVVRVKSFSTDGARQKDAKLFQHAIVN